MAVYNATATQRFYCAFRCVDCLKMNVTIGTFKAVSGGIPDKKKGNRSVSAKPYEYPATVL